MRLSMRVYDYALPGVGADWFYFHKDFLTNSYDFFN